MFRSAWIYTKMCARELSQTLAHGNSKNKRRHKLRWQKMVYMERSAHEIKYTSKGQTNRSSLPTSWVAKLLCPNRNVMEEFNFHYIIPYVQFKNITGSTRNECRVSPRATKSTHRISHLAF